MERTRYSPYLYPDCAGVMTVFLAEILSMYPYLDPPNMQPAQSNRLCNILTLMQCVASDESSREAFLNGTTTLPYSVTIAQLPLYVYPFLNTTSKSKPFEFLRLTSLGVIGALVKNDNSAVISYLLTTEIIPLCLRIIEIGNELSKTVAIFIIQKILIDDYGLSFICDSEARLTTVLDHFAAVLRLPNDNGKTTRLLKHVIRCYLRITESEKGLKILRKNAPQELIQESFKARVEEDASTLKFWNEIRGRL